MEKKSCLLCNNNKFELISHRVRDLTKHKIIKCKKCHHIQLFPIPTLKEEKKFYDEDLQNKNIGDVGSVKRAYKKMIDDTIRRADLVRKITPRGGNILELGPGHGFFLKMMKKQCFCIHL